jgi:transcriptional regulator with XRE-family HTH domain
MASRIEARANPGTPCLGPRDAGFSAGVAADRLKLSVDRLEAWERGEARPSLPQLRKVANLYRLKTSVLRKKSRCGRLKAILMMETAENRSGGDTMPARSPMTD